MTDIFDKIEKNKHSYFNRLVRAFKPIQPISPFDKLPPPAIPRAFRNLDPSDLRWAARPQNMLSLFQKM